LDDVISDNSANQDQKDYWSDGPGKYWIEYEDQLDSLFQVVTETLLARADPKPAEAVLDIGSGTGANAIAIARHVGPKGVVVATDIAEPLLGRARARAEIEGADNLKFVIADAQTHSFGVRQFDLIVSRFGTMFFSNPVQAFKNLRTALRPGGRLCMVCWAPAQENPWFHLPRDAAIARLGMPQRQPPTTPGPLAFSDKSYVLDILKDAGFPDGRAELEDVEFLLPGSAAAAASLAGNVGPAARIMKEFQCGAEDRLAIEATIEQRFAQYHHEDGLRIPGKLWFYSA